MSLLPLFAMAGVGVLTQPAVKLSLEFLSETQSAKVTLDLPKGESAPQFRMAAWAPGDYQIWNFGNQVRNAEFFRNGKITPSKRSPNDPNLWQVPGGYDRVVTTVRASNGNFTPWLALGKDYAFVSPAGVLGWVPGFENRKMLLTVKPPQEWKRATLHCAPPTKDGTVQAGDYFELIDSPFVIGENLTVETRSVGKGKEVVTVGFGKPELKLGPIADLLADLAKENEKLFGENPVDRFVLLCDFDGFASGLEHRASSRVGLWSTSPQQVQGLISHEYFHIFNIKRIRPKGIGPLDLTQPAKTPSLWFAEGVTDYYAEVILTRLGRQTKQEFLKGMATMLQRFQQRRSRSQATAIESSLRVWEVKGSQGYGVSYYEVGWLIGATLDLAIRRESKQKFSLDDVMRALYKSHKRPDGFTEVELRQICTTYGGPQLGEIYDDCVNSTGSPPLGQELRSAGYTWNGRDLVAPEETRHKYPYDLRSP